MPDYVLDTSAIFTVLNNEPGVDTVVGLLSDDRESSTVYLPFMALMELEYVARRKIGADEALNVIAIVKSWPVTLEESSDRWRSAAAAIKAVTSLSVADAWICALAKILGAHLVHKDPEYDAVENLMSLRLPYKS